eukprot:2796841-Rhodomonas_salina.2
MTTTDVREGADLRVSLCDAQYGHRVEQYAMSGTDIRGFDTRCLVLAEGYRCTMRGTDRAYDAVQCARMVLCDVRYCASASCYAMSGTKLCHLWYCDDVWCSAKAGTETTLGQGTGAALNGMTVTSEDGTVMTATCVPTPDCRPEAPDLRSRV